MNSQALEAACTGRQTKSRWSTVSANLNLNSNSNLDGPAGGSGAGVPQSAVSQSSADPDSGGGFLAIPENEPVATSPMGPTVIDMVHPNTSIADLTGPFCPSAPQRRCTAGERRTCCCDALCLYDTFVVICVCLD